MQSSPLGSTHDRMTSGVACHHRLWAAHTVEQHHAWHDIIAFGQHTWSEDVGRGMTSPPLESTHGGQRRAWHAITVLRKHTRSDDVRRDMPSPPLDSTNSRTTSGVACNHRPWMANMAERHWAWHAIIAFGQHRRSDGVGRCMPSPALASTHNQMTSGVACHHRLWGAHRIERCRALHAIITFGQHTRSDDVGRGMTLPPLENTHDRQRQMWHDDITTLGPHTRSATSGVA